MSVAINSHDEMQRTLDQLKQLLNGPEPLHVTMTEAPDDGPPMEEDKAASLAWSLECAWIAQYAAAARTYFVRIKAPHAPDVFTPQALDPGLVHTKARDNMVDLADQLGLILYNTVSNGGTDFCPAPAREILESIRLQLYRRAAKQSALHKGPAKLPWIHVEARRRTG
jgi:hypothetical protein